MEKCPNHGFSELHQIDTFYNGLSLADQDSLNVSSGGNLLARNTREAFGIIENKARVRTSRNKYSTSNANNKINEDVMKAISELKNDSSNAIAMLTKRFDSFIVDKTPNQVNVVNQSQNHGCETCGGPHSYFECPATGAYGHENVYAMNSGGNGYQPPGDRNILSYRSPNSLGPPPGFNNSSQNQSQNRNQGNVNQNRTNGFQNQGYNQNQNRGNFQNNGVNNQGMNQGQNQGFQNQGNFNQGPNQGNFSNNHGNQSHGNLIPSQPSQVDISQDFANYVKINDTNLRAMQNQINNVKFELKNEMQKELNTILSKQTH